MDLDTRHLRAFVAVVDEETFTDAAIALRTSQASVSRSVQRLEATLGQRLLARSTRKVETTAAGDRVLPHARRLLAALARLEEAAATGEVFRVGYAWAALGEHTVAVQRAWDDGDAGELEYVHSNTPTAGLLEGLADASVLRRTTGDARLACTQVGSERRYAALADDHPLAARTTVRLADFVDEQVAVDVVTGTTSEDLWEPGTRPAGFRMTSSVDEWLTLIASGRAVGISGRGTATQHLRPGVTYRLVEDAPPVPVYVAWWRDAGSSSVEAFIAAARAAYDAAERAAYDASERAD